MVRVPVGWADGWPSSPGALADPGCVAGPLKVAGSSSLGPLGCPAAGRAPPLSPAMTGPDAESRPPDVPRATFRNPTDDHDHTNSPLGRHRPVALRRRWIAIERLTSSRTSSA